MSWIIGSGIVMIGELNLVAPLLSMCFLLCYSCATWPRLTQRPAGRWLASQHDSGSHSARLTADSPPSMAEAHTAPGCPLAPADHWLRSPAPPDGAACNLACISGA